MRYLLCVILISSVFAACKIDTSVPQSPASGTIDEIVVVMDEMDWRGELGDTVRYYLTAPVEVFPQYESTFDVRYVKPQGFTDLLRNARNVIIFSSLTEKKHTSKLATELFDKKDISVDRNVIGKKNAYGKGQQILFVYGKTNKHLIDYLNTNNQSLVQKIASNEDSKLRSTLYLGGDNPAVSKKVKEAVNVDLKVPKEYKVVLEKDDLIWLRYYHEKYQANLVIQSLPKTALEKNIGIAVRNLFGKAEVKGSNKGSYMSTEDKIDWLTRSVNLNGKKAIETKGLWMMTKDFLGGPFKNYVVEDIKNNRTLFIEGFVMAPQGDKRLPMRQLDYLMRNTKF